MAMRAYPYYGGKFRMVEEILMLMPECNNWYELFGGSCAMTLNHYRSQKETVNELNKNIFNLLKVMQDDRLYERFREEIWKLEYCKDKFEKAKKAMREGSAEQMDIVESALYTFTLITQSFNNLGQSFSNKSAVNYKEVNAYNAHSVHKRLAGVEILNRDALELLDDIKADKDAFAVLDPPYLHRYRGKGADKAYGEYEMDEGMHGKMLNIAKDAECKIMICGYRSPNDDGELYDQRLSESQNKKWHCYLLTDIHRPNKGGKWAKEYVWVNYELPSCAKYYISMDDKMAQ